MKSLPISSDISSPSDEISHPLISSNLIEYRTRPHLAVSRERCEHGTCTRRGVRSARPWSPR